MPVSSEQLIDARLGEQPAVVGAPSSSPITGHFVSDLGWGVGLWLVTSIVILGSGWFGWMYIKPSGDPAANVVDSFRKWDGGWYLSIIDRGYSFVPGQISNTAFFPAYPLLSAALQKATGWSNSLAMLVASQICLVIGFVAFFRYLRLRWAATIPNFAPVALLVFALFPPTFFFRVCYSESLFFCLTALALMAVERRAPLVVLAFIAGLATGTRPVGVTLVLVVVREIWIRSDTTKGFFVRSIWLVPLSLWGLIAYSYYLFDRFGEPLAFVKAQDYWNAHLGSPLSEKLYALATLKPIWGSFVVDSGHVYEGTLSYGLSQSANNAIVYLFGLFLMILGAWKRWLNSTEFILTLGLLGIPYLTRGFESQFLSFARFTSLAIPIYIALAMLLLKVPKIAQLTWLLICSWIAILLTALFCAGYHIV